MSSLELMLKNVEKALREFGEFGEYESQILRTMKEIDRAYFVGFKNSREGLSYQNIALDIGFNQTISQPSTVARFLQVLSLKQGQKVLEIGTGSGYFCTLAARIVGFRGLVVSLERIYNLCSLARANSKPYIEKFGLNIVIKRMVDFRRLSSYSMYDRIVFSCGVSNINKEEVLSFLNMHLNFGGLGVFPFGEVGESGPLMIFEKNENSLVGKPLANESYIFVPLIL